MSRPGRALERREPRNRVTSLGSAAVVRRLHDRCAVWIGAIAVTALAGCFLPPSLSVSTGDGGPGASPPSILSVSADEQTLVEPGPVTFGVDTNSTALVALLDTDVDNTLTVLWFVDQSLNSTPRVTCGAAPDGMTHRTATCELSSLCQPIDLEEVPPETCSGIPCHDLEIVVYDQPLSAGNQVPTGGLSTNVFYHLECEAQ